MFNRESKRDNGMAATILLFSRRISSTLSTSICHFLVDYSFEICFKIFSIKWMKYFPTQTRFQHDDIYLFMKKKKSVDLLRFREIQKEIKIIFFLASLNFWNVKIIVISSNEKFSFCVFYFCAGKKNTFFFFLLKWKQKASLLFSRCEEKFEKKKIKLIPMIYTSFVSHPFRLQI